MDNAIIRTTSVPNNTTISNRGLLNYTATNGAVGHGKPDGTPYSEHWQRISSAKRSLGRLDPNITSNAVYGSMMRSALSANSSPRYGDDITYRQTVKTTRERAELRLIDHKAGP